jgi:pimeloyl-ACP methyl ester carboxylesterase
MISGLALCCILLCETSNAAVRAKSETFRTSDGVSLHYLDAGSGPAIVLIPGWTMPADIFEPQINLLSERFRVVALDPRSQGVEDTDQHRRSGDVQRTQARRFYPASLQDRQPGAVHL